MSTMSATYSPEDNKLRLYSLSRLPKELYDRVKAAGFSWAPKQELFVAPMWTPAREDLLIELCGEIGDEDTSLVERAEERADRFEEYHEKRADDAQSAFDAAEKISNGIPFGQPILIAHHSERHARRDAEKIENGMRRAVKMWETSQYWERRAAGALAHAKYKELPRVRARRIKGLKADLRRCEAAFTPCSKEILQPRWNATGENPPRIPHVLTGQGRARHWTPVEDLPRIKASYIRWMAHYHNRILYETAMLNEQGAGALIAPKPRPKQLPLLNYKVDSLPVNHYGKTDTWKMIELTSEQYKSINEDYRGTATINGSHRVRMAIVHLDEAGNYMPRRFPGWKDTAHVLVFLTDSKAHPQPSSPAPEAALRRIWTDKGVPSDRQEEMIAEITAKAQPGSKIGPFTIGERSDEKFQAMKESLRGGVKVVSANQLFPTPPELAKRVVELADIRIGHTVLEPSAGTGNLIAAVRDVNALCPLNALEINFDLAESLRARWAGSVETRCADFLSCNGDLGKFDRIVMNPPFETGSDIAHILHARKMLKPGGRLVAICANGPKQRRELQPIATDWIDLEPGSFAASGTNVNAAILVIDAE